MFESCLDVCGKCGSIAHKISGIKACLSSRRPPGYAGGQNKPYSARSYDKCMEENFKVMKITDCVHKEGPNGEKIPVCSFANKPALAYDSAPNPNGRSFPIKAYTSQAQMNRDLSNYCGGPVNVPMKMDGKDYALPNVHPTFEVGAQFGARQKQNTLKERTLIVARHRE